MNKLLPKILILVTAILFSSFTFAEPENLYKAKQAITKYYDTGAYKQDIAKVIAKAQNYLSERLKQKNAQKQKLAIILDIDDTAISDYASLVAIDFGSVIVCGTKQHLLGNYPAIPETLKLYQYAKQHGIAIFFVTGRGEDLKSVTIENLKKAGYNNWEKIYFRPSDYHVTPPSIAPYKIGARKMIAEEGYTIILNLGDQNSDLIGGYAERTFKLPNPFYYSH